MKIYFKKSSFRKAIKLYLKCVLSIWYTVF